MLERDSGDVEYTCMDRCSCGSKTLHSYGNQNKVYIDTAWSVIRRLSKNLKIMFQRNMLMPGKS